MTKPLYFYNGTTFELVGPTTPQSPIAYQTSAPTAPATGDIWIDSDGDVDTYNRQLTRYYFVATAGQTSISGVDANGLTLAYVAGSEQVYVNGALQVRGQDYTATNGTSITGLSALALNDVVEVFAYTAFTVANAYTKSETDGVAAAAPGLRMVVPSSIAVGSGTGSANAAGFVTFSGASSVSLNDVFSSTYDNYKLIYAFEAGSTVSNTFRLRVGGVDASGADYNHSSITWQTTNNPTNNGGANTATSAKFNEQHATSGSRGFWEIQSPFLAKPTMGQRSGVYVTLADYGFFTHNLSISYTGLTITFGANTTGTIGVYGYKD